MAMPYHHAPHADPVRGGVGAPNAALLIDFDNVTMGMRSDLAKELKHLLDTDIIKGKVTVQRAYADWRRYPQYIVPLSEASIDLIFAPAYGSSKKNATDIRMAIDGMELVFIRPEIGTFILLTGDSDFSSLVLKLKEYGKYVIGIGIQESSSDILVQNCDEYYSYTALTGLTKTTDLDRAPADPWECVKEAVDRMVARNDVMRSDRLKQVMLEISPSFDEADLRFKKFSKFLIEAANRGLIHLSRGENGQYEVGPAKSGGRNGSGAKTSSSRSSAAPATSSTSTSSATAGRSTRGRGRGRGTRGSDRRVPKETVASTTAPENLEPTAVVAPTSNVARRGAVGASKVEKSVTGSSDALNLLSRAMREMKEAGRDTVRDSDVKRRMLSIQSDFDETTFGFPKFSKFLLHSEEQGIVALEKLETGNFRVTLVVDAAAGQPAFESASQFEPASEANASDQQAEIVDTRDVTSAAIQAAPSDVESEPIGETAPNAEVPQETAPVVEGFVPVVEAPSTEAPVQREAPESHASAKTDSIEAEASNAETGATPTRTSRGRGRRPSGMGPRRGERAPRDGGGPIFLEGQIAGMSTSQSSASAKEATAPSVTESTVGASIAEVSIAEVPIADVPTAEAPAEVAGESAPTRQAVLSTPTEGTPSGPGSVDARALGLPTTSDSMISYLSNRYKGVGSKTAEALVEAFGGSLFSVFQDDPERVRRTVPASRADQVLKGWAEDYARRTAVPSADGGGNDAGDALANEDGRASRGGRSRRSGSRRSRKPAPGDS